MGDSLLPIVDNPQISWYNAANGRGIALTTIDGSVSMRVQLPGGDDWRYTRYPDGTQEMYNITDDPNEHVNRVNFDTGQGLTAADNTIRATLSNLMDGQLDAERLSPEHRQRHADRQRGRRDVRDDGGSGDQQLCRGCGRRYLCALPQRRRSPKPRAAATT